MNKKNYIFGVIFALLFAGLFSSCVVIAAGDNEELYNFEFVSDHILECNYSGYVTSDDIESVEIYDNRGYCRYSSTVTSTSFRDSRITFILDRNLRDGWSVEITINSAFSRETYKVYYED